MKNKIMRSILVCMLFLSVFTIFTFTISAESERIYDHIDVRFAGTLTIDKKVDGISQSGYPKTINVAISDVHAIVNEKKIDTFYEKSGTGIEHEWRADKLSLATSDSVTIKCKVTGSDNGEIYVVDFEKTYDEDGLKAAVLNCPGKSGFDFDINSKEIEEIFTSTVTFKTEVGGTINNDTKDIIYSGFINGESFPVIPMVEENEDYVFIGWAQLINNEKVENEFPKKVKGDSTWIAQFKEVKGSLNFNKTDEDKNPVEGAEYLLYNDVHSYSAISDEEGMVSFDKIKIGTYTLKETKASEGFLLNEEETTIIITKEMCNIEIENKINEKINEHFILDKKVNKDVISYQDELIYTIVIVNDGNVDLENLEVIDEIDDVLDVISINDKAYTDSFVSYIIPSLKVNESFTLEIKTKANTKVKKDTEIINIAFINKVESNEVKTTLKAEKESVKPPVDTDDKTNVMLWGSVLVMSILVGGVVYLRYKERNE